MNLTIIEPHFTNFIINFFDIEIDSGVQNSTMSNYSLGVNETQITIKYNSNVEPLLYNTLNYNHKIDLYIDHYHFLGCYIYSYNMNQNGDSEIVMSVDYFKYSETLSSDIIIARRNETIDNILND